MNFTPTFENSLLKGKTAFSDTITGSSTWINDGLVTGASLQNREVVFDLGKNYDLTHYLMIGGTPLPDRMSIRLYDENFKEVGFLITTSSNGDYTNAIREINHSKIRYVSLSNKSGTSWTFNEMNVWGVPTPINKFLILSNDKYYSFNKKDIEYKIDMTSNTTPYPYEVQSGSFNGKDFEAWRAFNNSELSNVDRWISANDTSTNRFHLWIQIKYPNKIVANTISMKTVNLDTSPKDFKILGSNDGVTWDTISEFKNVVWTNNYEKKTFDFENNNAYLYYRLKADSLHGGATTYAIILSDIIYGLKNIKILKELSSNSEENFIKNGIDKSTEIDLTVPMSNKVIVQQNFTSLSDGKVIKISIDTLKTPIKKLTIE